jgi:membrane protein DedA with SNARE-associated domain
MLQSIWSWLTTLSRDLGYAGIFGLMALESSFFPFPSEVVVPPGGANAKVGEMSLVLVIAFGIAGSILGALFNYWLAVKLGRPFCIKYGRYFLLSEKKFRKSEEFFRRHGEIGTFVGRLIPGVRQIISFPAGLAKMHVGRFCFFTALGAGIWVTVLALIGYAVGPDIAGEIEEVKKHSTTVLLWMVPALVLLVVGYIWWHKRIRSRPAPVAASGEDSGHVGEGDSGRAGGGGES